MAPGDLCWIWQRSKNKAGYPYFFINKKTVYAHRMAWVSAYGKIEDNLWVMHKCDNPSCCRPDHLSLGTPLENNKDMMNKKRNKFQTGDSHHNHKVVASDVMKIRSMSASGISRKEISSGFPIKPETVGSILRRDIWKHI